VIMASMGSYLRTRVYYKDIEKYLRSLNEWMVLWAYLWWENIHTLSPRSLNEKIFLVIGSEAHGIRDPIAPLIQRKITIPGFWGAESLNAWVATAVILDNLTRLISQK
jgi:TrmH family RNA methyltransferase